MSEAQQATGQDGVAEPQAPPCEEGEGSAKFLVPSLVARLVTLYGQHRRSAPGR